LRSFFALKEQGVEVFSCFFEIGERLMLNAVSLLTLAGQQAQKPEAGNQFMYMILMFGVIGFLFYVILVRPQKREQQERQRMLGAIKKGDKVVTIGGMHGVVVDLEAEKNQVVLEVAKNVRLTFSRTAISSIAEKEKS
jgi:preprotein translocase subunit YajC